MLSVARCSKIAVEAVEEANRRYENWTNGNWLNDAGVESIIQITLAELLAKERRSPSHSIDLEVRYSDMRERSGVKKKPGAPHKLFRGTARADVVLFDGSEQPKFCFEVKRAWISFTGANDIIRLCTLIANCGEHVGGSLRAGIFVFYDVKHPRARDASESEQKRQKIIKSIAESWGLVCMKREGQTWEQEYVEGKWSIRATAYSIEAGK